MVRGAYCGREGAELRVMLLPVRPLASPRAHVHERCRCLPCPALPSHPGAALAVFVSLFACGFVAMRGECIVGLPGSVGSALAYGAVSVLFPCSQLAVFA